VFVPAAALLSVLFAPPMPAAPLTATPAATPASDTLSPAITDRDLAGWVAESLIQDVRGRPQSENAWLSSRGFVDDLAIAAQVSGRLAAIGLHNLVVSCTDGQVNLRGRCSTEALRQRAAQLAAAVADVRGVDNLLRLPDEPAAPPAPAAAAVARKHERAPASPVVTDPFDFLTRDGLAGRGLVVKVIDGEVSLSGLVNNEAARLYATAAAHRVPGVRTVVNTLAVRPRNSIEDTGIALLVQRRIENSVTLKPVASAIRLLALDGVLQLRGTVNTEEQRLDAEALALDTQVVFAVSSFLEVDSSRIVPPAPRMRDFRLWKPY